MTLKIAPGAWATADGRVILPPGAAPAGSVVPIGKASDLPSLILAPDGVMRSPLENDTTYSVTESFVWPPLLIPKLTNFLGAQTVAIAASRPGVNMFLDGGGTPVPQIWGRETPFLLIRDLTVVDFSNSGLGRGTVMFDLVGGGPIANLSLDFSALINFKAIGKTMDIGMLFASVPMLGNEGGFIALQSGIVSFVQVMTTPFILQPADNAIAMLKPGMFFKCAGGGSTAIAVGPIENNSGDSAMAIDSGSVGGFQITGMSYQGPSTSGNFFRPDVSLGLTAMANADKSITAFAADTKAVVSASAGTTGTNFSTGAVRHQWQIGDTVTGAAFGVGAYNVVQAITELPDPFTYQVGALAFAGDSSGTATDDLATVCTSVSAGFTRGQTILIAGAPAAFNGARTIKSVALDENSFVIPIDFATGSAGTGTIKITRITTASDHPMVVGETQTISGTTSYNAETCILFTPADDTFDVPLSFVANDATGTVVSASRTQKSVGIFVRSCGAQPESRSIGVGNTNANGAATTIASSNVYQALDCSTMINNVVSERFTLTNSTDGIYTFNGTQPITVKVSAFVTAVKTGATQLYRFATSIDSAVPTFATAPYSSMEVKSTEVNTTVSHFVQLSAGQTIQIMIAPEGHTDNITISDYQFQVEAVG